MKTSQKILEYITEKGQVSGKELTDYLGSVTDRAIRKQLKTLLEKGEVRKIGQPPKVFYSIVSCAAKKENAPTDISVIDRVIRRIIDDRYLYITSGGEMKHGWEGFVLWCEKTRQDPIKTGKEYVSTVRKYDAFSKNGLLDGMRKIRNTFDEVFLDKLFYLDFYSIERFGKTKLGQILLHAKQSQDRKLMRSLIEDVRPKILALIKRWSIDGVLFVPPTLKREVQFMKELEKYLKLPTRILSVSKVKTPVVIAQKTLTKLEDRIENARKTIVVEESATFENILIIDDAVGSGSTLNETAAQIRKRGLCRGKVIGLAITGSFKGFDVISEV